MDNSPVEEIDETSTLEQAKNYIKKKVGKYQRQSVDALEKQMQKWRSLKEKREEEKILQEKIKVNELKLDEASKIEDYDMAEELQKQIDMDMQNIQSISRLMLNLDKQRFELENMIAKIRINEGM